MSDNADATEPTERPAQFQLRFLSVIAYARGFTLWHYNGTDATLAELCAEGFFDRAELMIASRDAIYISASDGLAHLCFWYSSPGRVRLEPLR